jgi:hypothetical protein
MRFLERGQFARRLHSPPNTKAIAAEPHRLIYRMLCYGIKYVDQGAAFYEAQFRKHQVTYIKRKAAKAAAAA